MTEQNNHPLNESLSALVDGEATPLELRRLLKASASESELNERWSRYHLASAAMRRDLGAVAPAGFAAGVSKALEQEPSAAFDEEPSAAVNEEPSAAFGDKPSAAAKPRSWWQGLGRVAVAASVAGAVLIGVQQYPGGFEAGAGSTSVASGSGIETNEAQTQSGTADREPVSLPAGYQAPAFPAARTASAQSGYEPAQRTNREVIFVPVQSESSQVPVEEIRAYLNQLMQEHSAHAARNSNQGVLPFARASSEDDN